VEGLVEQEMVVGVSKVSIVQEKNPPLSWLGLV